MMRGLALAVTLALMTVPASAQAPASLPVEVTAVELDVDGRRASSVTQVGVSGSPVEADRGGIVLSVVSNFVGAADRTLEAWFEQGASAPQRTLTLRLINRLGRAATYDLQGCTLSSRSFVVPDTDGGFLQETWSIGCATMRRV